MRISKEEYIYHDSWKQLCDEEFETDESVLPQRDCLVYVPLDQIPRFFHECSQTDYKYIVVSGNSDYSLCYQKEYPMYQDMVRWLDFIDWKNEVHAYEDYILKARCYKHFCKIQDRFSLRFYSFTGHTFNEIPDNVVKWYSTNSNVDEVESIPFGIPRWEKIQYYETKEFSQPALYVCQNNTRERLALKNRYGGFPEMSHDEYYRKLALSYIVICPEGNGLDCYRTLETIYSGGLPVIVTNGPNRWCKVYGNIDCPFQSAIEGVTGIRDFDMRDINFLHCKLPYWKQRLKEDKITNGIK